jgi:hypothetical protein
MADTCRCHLPFDPPDGPHWWPRRGREPGPHVRAVASYGADPGFLRWDRTAGGWHCEGSGANHPDCTPAVSWPRVGCCWAGTDHPVVDVTRQFGS